MGIEENKSPSSLLVVVSTSRVVVSSPIASIVVVSSPIKKIK